MTKQAIEDILSPLGRFAGRTRREENSSTPVWSLWRQLRLWAARRRQRAQLRALAEQNNHLLRDIGITRRDALNEAAKPFWFR